MALTSPYAKLAAIAPGKPKHKPSKKYGSKKPKPATKENHPQRWVYQTLPPAPGTKRYTLSLPPGRYHDAISAGCHFDQELRIWYIDNPKNLADFAAWKPRLMGFDRKVKALKKLHQTFSPGGDSH